MDSPGMWVDFIATLLVLAVLGVFWWKQSRTSRRYWLCVRYQGGGRLESPKPMTDVEVTEWLGRLNCEVTHIDYEYGFVFYRPRGGR